MSTVQLESLDEMPNRPTEPSTSKQTFETEMFLSINSRERSTQTTKKQSTRSVKTQTLMTATSTFFQTKSAVEYPSISEAQPVGKVTDTDNTQGKPRNVDTNTTDSAQTTTEVDVESIKSSTSKESVTPHDDFIPIEASSTESDESSEDVDSDKRTILVEGKPPQEQIKFIVFEEAILDVFGKCGQCGSKCIVTMENQIGSSCKICSSCTAQNEHYFEWTTGPCVFKMPAFHLLFASGILATGMESAKVLRLFDALNIPNVKQRELSNILKNYVIPAVYKVWQVEQSARLREIEGVPIVIASDMRVDSPGHSGLFGSGSTLDMKRNVILDTQVIKVNLH